MSTGQGRGTVARWMLVLGALSCASCTVVLRRDRDQCHTSDDCQSLAIGAVCTESGICQRLLTQGPSTANPQACQLDSDCTEDRWSVCRDGLCKSLATGTCIGLTSSRQPSVRDRLPFAVLVPSDELSPSAMGPHLSAASGAFDELRDAFDDRGDPFPELVGVACDEANPGYQQLADAGVRLLLGPMENENVEAARAGIAGQGVLFSPYAEAPELDPALSTSTPVTSIVSCKPNRNGAKASLLTAARFVQDELRERALIVEDSTVVLALSDEESSLGMAFDKAELDSASIRELDYTYDASGQGLVTSLKHQSPMPSLIVSASAIEDWGALMNAVDTAAVSPYPFYLLSDKRASVAAVLGEVNGSDHPAYQRTVALDYALSSDNTDISVASAGLDPGLDYVRDCVYLGVYSAIAGQLRYQLTTAELSAAAILVGLRAFDGGGRQLDTSAGAIAKVLQELQGSRGFDASVKLIGGSGDFDLVGVLTAPEIVANPTGQYVRPSPRDQRLYCIDPNHGFIGTPLVFPSSGAAPAPVAADALGCLQSGGQ